MQVWLREEGLQDLIASFTTHNIDGAELSRLNKDTAAELGIGEAGNTQRGHEHSLTLGFHFPFVGISCSTLKPKLQAPVEEHDVSCFFSVI